MSVLRRSNRLASLRSLFAQKHPTRVQVRKASRKRRHSPGTKLAEPRQPRESNLRDQPFCIREAAAELSSTNQRILRDFSGSMQATRQEIAGDVSRALSNTQETLNQRLSSTVASYEDELDTYQATREAALAPFHSKTDSSPFTDTSERIHQLPAFRNKLDEVRDVLRTHEKALEGQWKDWTKAQQKIICLGVEILGVEMLNLDDAQTTSNLNKRLRNAASESDKQIAWEEDLQSALSAQSTHIRSVTKELLKQSVAQEKKLRESKRKQMEQISLLAKAMMETI